MEKMNDKTLLNPSDDELYRDGFKFALKIKFHLTSGLMWDIIEGYNELDKAIIDANDMCDHSVKYAKVDDLNSGESHVIIDNKCSKPYTMHFTEIKTSSIPVEIHYRGKRNNFNFTIRPSIGFDQWYVVARHSNKDISFNTLLNKGVFTSLDSAKYWCQIFNPKNHKLEGKDA